jgi:cytidylate kinase
MPQTKISTITISRQMGSLGRRVAEETVERLGYRLIWRELVNEAARRSGKPELALAAFDDLGLLGINASTRAFSAYRKAMEEVIEEIAAQGKAVIVGRAGQIVLRNRPDVLHVRVIAPLEVRISRVALQQNIEAECAQAQIESSDRHRKNFLRRFYKVRWDDPSLYDLIINTGRFTPENAAEIICKVVRLSPKPASANPMPEEELS